MTRCKKIFLLGLVLGTFGLNHCGGKEGLEIGRENPDQEIQKCLALSKKKVYSKAVECLEIFKSRFPQTQWGEEAELKIADTHFMEHQYLLAAETYLAFAKMHPSHPQIDYALFRAGLSYLRESPKSIDRDQQYLFKAVGEFKKLLRQSPNTIYLDQLSAELRVAEVKVAQRLFYVGRFYYRTGEYIAAIPRLRELAEKFSHFGKTPKALYLVAKAGLKLNQLETARQAVEILLVNYPKNPWTKKAHERYLRSARRNHGSISGTD